MIIRSMKKSLPGKPEEHAGRNAGRHTPTNTNIKNTSARWDFCTHGEVVDFVIFF